MACIPGHDDFTLHLPYYTDALLLLSFTYVLMCGQASLMSPTQYRNFMGCLHLFLLWRNMTKPQNILFTLCPLTIFPSHLSYPFYAELSEFTTFVWTYLSRSWWGICNEKMSHKWFTLQWRHNERDCFLYHQPCDCLPNRIFKAQIKENIKAPRHCPLWGEFTGDRWILPQKGQ